MSKRMVWVGDGNGVLWSSGSFRYSFEEVAVAAGVLLRSEGRSRRKMIKEMGERATIFRGIGEKERSCLAFRLNRAIGFQKLALNAKQ